jgi:hypothetical protein
MMMIYFIIHFSRGPHPTAFILADVLMLNVTCIGIFLCL